MKHTVFIQDKPLRFVDSNEVEQWKGNTNSIFISEKDMTIEDALQELEQTENHPGFIYMSVNPKVSWQIFISYCKLVEAAGGIVENEKGEYLIILRHGKWDLPKGKLEADETVEEAGIREVEEECGIDGLKIIKPLQNTFHTYFLDGKRKLKKTHWFLMKSNYNKKLTPQVEEDIQKAEWMTKEKIRDVVVKNTYGAIGELLKEEILNGK